MSGLYESIPEEQKLAYLKNAEEAVNEATGPVLEALGQIAVNQAELYTVYESPVDTAEQLLQQDARAAELAADAEKYAAEHDLQQHFMESMDDARTKDVVAELDPSQATDEQKLKQSLELFSNWHGQGANDIFFRLIGNLNISLSDRAQTGLINSGYAEISTNESGISEFRMKRQIRNGADFRSVASILRSADDGMLDAVKEQSAALALDQNANYMDKILSDPDKGYADLALTGACGLAAHGYLSKKDMDVVREQLYQAGAGEAYIDRAEATVTHIAQGAKGGVDLKAAAGYYDVMPFPNKLSVDERAALDKLDE